MTTVTVLGLGPMGRALTAAVLDARYRTTVWNRTEAKAREVLDRGAVWAPSSAGAVAASDVTLIWPVRNPSATDPPPSTSVSDEVASVT